MEGGGSNLFFSKKAGTGDLVEQLLRLVIQKTYQTGVDYLLALMQPFNGGRTTTCIFSVAHSIGSMILMKRRWLVDIQGILQMIGMAFQATLMLLISGKMGRPTS